MNSHALAWNTLPILFCSMLLWIPLLQYYQTLSWWSEATLVCHLLIQYLWVGTSGCYLLEEDSFPYNIFERYAVPRMNFGNTEEGKV